MYRHDCTSAFSDCSLNQARVDIERLEFNINEHRDRPLLNDSVCGCRKAKVGNDHFVTRANTRRVERDVKTGRSRTRRETMVLSLIHI